MYHFAHFLHLGLSSRTKRVLQIWALGGYFAGFAKQCSSMGYAGGAFGFVSMCTAFDCVGSSRRNHREPTGRLCCELGQSIARSSAFGPHAVVYAVVSWPHTVPQN